MDLFKYSVIIPHHDIPSLLERCLSTIPQKPDVQVIVVDDHSSGQNVEELQRMERLYTNYLFIYECNGVGAGAARNTGLNYASGTWLIFVDADDLLKDNAYELWESRVKETFDIVYYLVDSVYTDTLLPAQKHINKIEAYNKYKGDALLLEKWLRYCYPEPWGKLIKRSFVEDYNIKFQESMVANDYLFSVKCGHLASKIDFATDIFYTYTERKDSLSNVMLDKTEKVASRLEVYYQVEKYCSANGVCVHPFSLLVSSIVIKRRKFVHCVRSICRKYKLNFVRVIILSYYYRFLVYCLNLRRLPC